MQAKYQIKDFLQIKDVIISMGYKFLEECKHEDTYFVPEAIQYSNTSVSDDEIDPSNDKSEEDHVKEGNYRYEGGVRVRFNSVNGKYYFKGDAEQKTRKKEFGQIEIATHKGKELNDKWGQAFDTLCKVKTNRLIFASASDEESKIWIALDNVDGVGTFAEIGTHLNSNKQDIVFTKDEEADTWALIKDIATKMGLSSADRVYKTYPAMVTKLKAI